MQTSPSTDKYISKRVGATLIDYTLIYILTFFYIYTAGEQNQEGTYVVTGLPALVPMFIWFLYFVIAEYNLGGTLGHQLLKIKVVSIDNSSLHFGQILVRRIADIIEISWCFGLIAFIIAKSTDKNQRLGDLWAKTIVTGASEESNPIKFDFEN